MERANVTGESEDCNPRTTLTTFDLTTTASTRLGFAPSRTMARSTKALRSGHITYMRTDSVNLGAEAVAKISQCD